MALSESKLFLKLLIAHAKKKYVRLVVKSRELDAKLKELEAQAEVNLSIMELIQSNSNLSSSAIHIKCQAWPRIVATATKNNIGAPAARALLEEVSI